LSINIPESILTVVPTEEIDMGQRIGYQRVSTLDQNAPRQLDGIELDKVFTDKASGKGY
jgi:hypothetical protein